MTNPRVVRSRIALFVAFFALVLTLISFSPAAAEPPLPNLGTFTLQGRVYDGFPFDQSRPMQGVTVKLYRHANPGSPDPGALFKTTTTNSTGYYSFTFSDVDVQRYAYLSIRETNPGGYTSVDATTVGGVKKENDWIEYQVPLGTKVLTGNKFWDWRDARPTASPTPTRANGPIRHPSPIVAPAPIMVNG